MVAQVNSTDSLCVQSLPVPEGKARKVEKEEKIFPTSAELSEVGLGAMSTGMRTVENFQESDVSSGFFAFKTGISFGKAIGEQVDKIINWLNKE